MKKTTQTRHIPTATAQIASPWSRMSLQRRDIVSAWILVLPALIFMITILVFPLVWSINLSFTDKVVGADYNYIGFQNYLNLFQSAQFRNALKTTVIFTFLAILFKTIFGVILALLMNMEFRGRNIARALLIIPWSLPNIVSVLNWKWIFSTHGGAVNEILRSLGFIDKSIAWTSTAALAMFVVVFVNVWRGTPFIGISVLSKLQTIDSSYYEAAHLDGANALQRFWYITLPSIKNALIVAVLVSTIWTVNEFELVWVMTGGGPAMATELLSVFSYRTVLTYRTIGTAAAVPIVLMPVLLFLIGQVSKFRNESM